MSENELVIEEAQVSDAQLVYEFLKQVTQETSYIVNDNQDMTILDFEEVLANNLNSLSRICLLAKVQNKIIGILNVTSSDSFNGNSVGDLFIAVKKAYQGYGIGHFLMEMACDWAGHSPMLERIQLTVQARNKRAIKLYKDFGFEIKSIEKDALTIEDGTCLDLLIMNKWIGNKIE